MSRKRDSSYLLLTGATGLLGRFLLRDLSAMGRRVAVLVRGSKSANAESRVDELLRDWREVAGADVPRPVVLQGDITSPGLSLSASALGWVKANVDEVVHSAASLSFERREADGEPYASNVGGTANVLELCRTAGIRRLHHVSTAYVCGLRRGRVLETELDVGQTPGNDYERSKIESEQAVRAADFLDVLTVYRPSIIVGDLVNGFTNTFHGFYKPLRIVQPFVDAFASAELEPGSLLHVLGMSGEERKNLVPVDWVSAVMTRIILNDSLHGRTYHLTSDAPTSVGTLCRVFEGAVAAWAESRHRQQPAQTNARPARSDQPLLQPAMLMRLFLDQMHVYRAYWRDDPQFDALNTRRIARDLPAPAIDEASIRRLCGFAIANGFRWPPPNRERTVARDHNRLESLLGAAHWDPPAGPSLGLATTGPGGGQWTIRVENGRAVSLHIGLPAKDSPSVSLPADALASVLDGQSSIDLLRAQGAVVINPKDEHASRVADDVLRSLARPDFRELQTKRLASPHAK